PFLHNRRVWKPSAIGFARIATRGSADWRNAWNASASWNRRFMPGFMCSSSLNSPQVTGRCSESHLEQKTLSRPRGWPPNMARLYIKDASVLQTLPSFAICAAAEPYFSAKLLRQHSPTAHLDLHEIRATWITPLEVARAVRLRR